MRERLLVVVVAVNLCGCVKTIPPPDIKVSTEEATLARGKYLADHSMGCVGCHSPRDWTHLGGPPVAGAEYTGDAHTSKEDGFPDSFAFGAPNLTPDHLKTWSDGDIARATVLGQTPEKKGLFPLMPYMLWRDNVALEDVAAVVAYLRTLPAKAGDPMPERKFPMPGFVINGFPEPRTLRATAPKPGDADFGQYITARSGCLDCHTNADDKGKLIGPRFAGGRSFPIPAPGKGKVVSANLTPDPDTGLGNMTREAFVARFRAATLEQARATAVDDTGFNTVMPWWAYSGMTEEELGGIYDYLRTLPPAKNAVQKHLKP